MSLPQRVASTQSNRLHRRPRSPLVAFEPAARSQPLRTTRLTTPLETGRSLALRCGPVTGKIAESAVCPKRHLPGPRQRLVALRDFDLVYVGLGSKAPLW